MKPEKPCPWCGATAFGVVERVRMEVTSSAKRGFGNVASLAFAMVICRGCGATQFFSKPDAVLDEFDYEAIDVARGD